MPKQTDVYPLERSTDYPEPDYEPFDAWLFIRCAVAFYAAIGAVIYLVWWLV